MLNAVEGCFGSPTIGYGVRSGKAEDQNRIPCIFSHVTTVICRCDAFLRPGKGSAQTKTAFPRLKK